MTTPKDRLDRFLEHLDALFEAEPELFSPESISPDSMHADAPKVVCMVYRDVPEPGSITGVTYGLSEVAHPEWRSGRPELIVSLDSTDVAWPLAIAGIANALRGECPFCYGDVVNVGKPIAVESEMSAFVVFAPSILEREQFLGIDVGGPQPLNLAGMYPIYDSERDMIQRSGLERFWNHPNFDLYDVKRPAVTLD